jgi:hypothetical protein
MPGYVPSRRVTHYFVQVEQTNPLGRRTGWQTVAQYDDDPDKAKAKRAELRKEGKTVRVAKREGVTGGYTSL